jgi:hypothetical protein
MHAAMLRVVSGRPVDVTHILQALHSMLQGLGGTYGGPTPASSLKEVVKYPFSGNWPVQGYSKDLDPWLRPGFRDYRWAPSTAPSAL